MLTTKEDQILTHLVELLELPDSAYEKAKNRYEDLGEWLGRDESVVTANDVHVFPQGSFRLGTAIRPLTDEEDYDLDLSCELRKGISKATHSQKNLKELIGFELERYRFARNIKEPLEPKHRCWRLKYADELSFHLDIVPSIPATFTKRKIVLDSITYTQAMDHDLAVAVANLAVEITDDQLPNYSLISDDWPISNTEGYAKWFIAKMRRKATAGIVFDKAQVDDLPI